jgi:Cu(I)/Ag(I) efflux system membrane protein CusA/SilA
VPLSELTELSYVKGPQVIKSEDTFLTSYVTFDHHSGLSTVEAVELIKAHLKQAQAKGQLVLPDGVRYVFEGSYKNQQRSAQRLSWLVPLALLLIFVVLYLQFRRVSTTLILGGGVAVAISGGFMLMGLYVQPWFMDVTLWTHNLRELFSIGPVYLSVAVWVGFIALVGIATDDGVVMATYLDQRFKRIPRDARSREAIREAVLDAGLRRVRPCLMTTATTLLALLPVVTSSGRGADIMRPMAIPCLGGMAVELVTLFVVPVLYCAREEWAHRAHKSSATSTSSEP